MKRKTIFLWRIFGCKIFIKISKNFASVLIINGLHVVEVLHQIDGVAVVGVVCRVQTRKHLPDQRVPEAECLSSSKCCVSARGFVRTRARSTN